MSADRLSGAFFFLFGVALYFAIIPAFVETAEGGNIAPNTIPNAVAWIIAAGGAWLAAKPTEFETPTTSQVARAFFFVAVLALGIFLISRFGFVVVAPFLACAIMALMGERRWHWFALGAIGMPALIWVLVTQVLDRGLI